MPGGWDGLRGEPQKLRAAIRRHDRRQLTACVRRLTLALTDLAPTVAIDDGPPRYERLAKLASTYNVHPKTLGRWLDKDVPDALLKRPRLTLVDKQRFAEWDARRQKRASGNRG
jgi:hypothetical protein